VAGVAQERIMSELQARGESWTVIHGDCVEGMRTMPESSVHLTITSIPFASIFTYSASERDMGNCSGHDQFFEHFDFWIASLLRVTKPGRLAAIHLMNLPTSKVKDGVIGLRDFRGRVIAAMEHGGWIYHAETCIWKDPVVAVQRTKALGLLYKQLKKDSCMSRMGIPDYIVVMRKPGANAEPVAHRPEDFPVEQWQKWASPVWMDIDQTDTLNRAVHGALFQSRRRAVRPIRWHRLDRLCRHPAQAEVCRLRVEGILLQAGRGQPAGGRAGTSAPAVALRSRGASMKFTYHPLDEHADFFRVLERKGQLGYEADIREVLRWSSKPRTSQALLDALDRGDDFFAKLNARALGAVC
jgi:hypothetical protein